MAVRKSEVVTGTFMLAALTVLVFLAFKSVKDLMEPGTRFIARFDDVGLLENDSPVSVSGYIVGRVKAVTPKTDPRPCIEVEFDVIPDVAKRLRGGTKITVAQASLLGGKFLSIEAVFDETKPAIVASGAEPYLIETGKSAGDMFKTIDEVKTMLAPLLQEATAVLTKIDMFLSADRMNELGETVENANGLLVDIRADLRKLDEKVLSNNGVLDNVNKILVEWQGFRGELESTIRGLEVRLDSTKLKIDGLLDEAKTDLSTLTKGLEDPEDDQRPIEERRSLLAKLRVTLDRANGTMKKLDEQLLTQKFFDDTKDTIANAKELTASANRVVANPDLTATFYEARLALQELKLLLNSLRADPSQVLFGGPGDAALLEAKKQKNETPGRSAGRMKPYDY